MEELKGQKAEPEQEEEEGVPFYPLHFLKEVICVFIVFGLLLALATFWPAPMEPKADPFSTPAHIKPEWYFLAAYQFLKVAEVFAFMGAQAPKVIGVVGPGVVFLLLLLWPFVGRRAEAHPSSRLFITLAWIVGIVFFITFTIWGHYS